MSNLITPEVLSNPTWARPPRAGQKLHGFSRTRLYELMHEGKVKTKAIGRMRFIHLPSLLELIENSSNDQIGNP